MKAKKTLKGALKRHGEKVAFGQAHKLKQKHREEAELAKKRKNAPKRPAWHPFDPLALTIFIGEADFSFARCCLEENYIGQTIATNYDSEQELIAKYPATTDNASYLHTDARVEGVHFGVDATDLAKAAPLLSEIRQFKGQNLNSTIDLVFNFPHLGTSIPDQDRNIKAHQQLMSQFFIQAHAINHTRVIVSLFDGEPYQSWDIKALARKAGYKLERSGYFDWDLFPSYSHCLTAKFGRTSKSQRDRKARFYLFVQNKTDDPQ